MLKFKLEEVPFTRAGAYQAFCKVTAPRWWLHRGPPQLVWRKLQVCGGTLASLSVWRGKKKILFREIAGPERLRLRPLKGDGSIDITFVDSTTLRFRGRGLTLRLETPTPGDYDMIQPDGDACWRLNLASCKAELRFQTKRGNILVDAPWDGVKCKWIRFNFRGRTATNDWEIVARETRWSRHHLEPLNITWKKWLRATPRVPKQFARARDLAAYITWSALVDPIGHFQRPAMYMSKNWMTNIWSWDHCFNAISLARSQPALAWDQLMVLFDFQTTSGQLPDCVNDEGILWNFVKPPIHGWALGEMMKRTSWIGKKELGEIYPKLAAWTQWWFRERDSDHDGLPQYNHGNDSGWDNATCFKVGMPVEGPDLAAFLVLQMDTLARISRRLGLAEESQKWSARADELLSKLLSHHWRGDHFDAPRSGDHKVHDSDSLVPFLPLVLGRRLPNEVSARLVAGLKQKGRFLTPHGLATESPRSNQYEPDGYWRGPIWAPPVLLVITGLADLGEHAFASEIARRFCQTCSRSGMAENFDALTGAGLRDRAYSWTASIFLLLASEWLGRTPRRRFYSESARRTASR